jgi:hypothetical protein
MGNFLLQPVGYTDHPAKKIALDGMDVKFRQSLVVRDHPKHYWCCSFGRIP